MTGREKKQPETEALLFQKIFQEVFLRKRSEAIRDLYSDRKKNGLREWPAQGGRHDNDGLKAVYARRATRTAIKIF